MTSENAIHQQTARMTQIPLRSAIRLLLLCWHAALPASDVFIGADRREGESVRASQVTTGRLCIASLESKHAEM